MVAYALAVVVRESLWCGWGHRVRKGRKTVVRHVEKVGKEWSETGVEGGREGQQRQTRAGRRGKSDAAAKVRVIPSTTMFSISYSSSSVLLALCYPRTNNGCKLPQWSHTPQDGSQFGCIRRPDKGDHARTDVHVRLYKSGPKWGLWQYTCVCS